MNGLDKGALADGHHHVDGVKVLLASNTCKDFVLQANSTDKVLKAGTTDRVLNVGLCTSRVITPARRVRRTG